MPSLFEADISTLKGVGQKRAELFRKLGAPTVGDLLRLYPRAYEDWRDAVPIRNTLLNEVNIVKGTVLRRPVEQRIRGGMTLYKTTITDGEDDMQLTFFNNKYVMNLLEEGAVYAFRGKVTGTFTRREMASPEFVPESRMQDILDVLQKNYRVGASLEQIAAACGMSYENLRKQFRGAVGCSLRQYLIGLRINKSKTMLLEERMPISRVAEELGYCDTYAFCHQFKQQVGISPGKYVSEWKNQ